jgi:putative endonuclease
MSHHHVEWCPERAPRSRKSRGTFHPTAYNVAVHFVYIVRCADGTLYTGWTRDPHRRVAVHNSGKGAKYTRSRLPVSLVYSEQCESLSSALKRERALKPWSRAKKEALIADAAAPLRTR